MRVLLIAPDSKIPNLALMKIATHHKRGGDEVGLNIENPDLIYVSIIFDWNKNIYLSIQKLYPNCKMIIGGPGYVPTIKLPTEIEQCPPDQTLYPNSEYSIGRVTSGCIRKCHFCMVHKLEPNGIRYIQSPSEIWKPGTILRLIDDNVLALPSAFKEIYDFCIENKVKLHMEYFDIRLINQENASMIAKLRHDTGIWFSFDFEGIEPDVRKGIETLIAAGINPRRIRFFVYVHDEESISGAKRRWDILRSYNCEPFLMMNISNRTPKLHRIQRRGCRPAIWRNMESEVLFECPS